MREFFLDEKPGMPFKIGDSIYLTIILLVFLGIFIIYKNREKIKNMDVKKLKIIRIVIAIVMLVNMALYYGSYLYYGFYDWRVDLPLHLCFIAGFLFIYILLTQNKKIYKLVYFLAFLGPLPAVIWPDLKSSFDSFIFYQFIISHHLFLLANIFIFYAFNEKFNKKILIHTFLSINIIFFFIAIFNAIFDTNYIMSYNLPPHILTMYPFLKPIGYPFVVLELLGIIIILIAYIPIVLQNQEKKLG